jgi:ferrous iron transport protein A
MKSVFTFDAAGRPPASPRLDATGGCSIAALAVGREAIVRRFRLPRPLTRRLLELGLLPGTHIRVVRHAPLGDPIELCLRNYALSIGREEALRIDVDPLP